MHEFAFGVRSMSALIGQCKNPWDTSRIPGGSSGGSGVAVATGMAEMALGTDTGGSIRIPAAINGITGLAPDLGPRPQCRLLPGQSLATTPSAPWPSPPSIARACSRSSPATMRDDPTSRNEPVLGELPARASTTASPACASVWCSPYYFNGHARATGAQSRGQAAIRQLEAVGRHGSRTLPFPAPSASRTPAR